MSATSTRRRQRPSSSDPRPDEIVEAADRVPAFALEARRGLYDSAPYVWLVGLYVVSSAFILRAIGRDIPYTFAEVYPRPAVMTLMYLAATLLIGIGVDVFASRRRPGKLDTWRQLFRRWFGTRRMVGALLILLTLPALLDVMVGYRQALTDVKPFTYDQMFMEWDRWLHFGRHPWEWLQPVLGQPAVTAFIDQGYVYGWVLLMWIGTIWQAVHGREPLRLQYFMAFAASWILLGTVAAIALSSAGPVYYGRVTGLEDPYSPLMAYLASVDALTPLRAVADHGHLWRIYRTWGGVTAMPSMHMAITTVVILTAIRSYRWLAVLLVPMWLLMMAGSVHLGWHYAIDGYFSTVAVGLIWLACGRFSAWWMERGPDAASVRHAA